MTTRRLALGAYGGAVLAVLVAPSLVVAVAARSGGARPGIAVDLVAAGAVTGLAASALAVVRLRRQTRTPGRGTDGWIAAVNSLVVLALTAIALLIAVFHSSARLHADLAEAGPAVLGVWVLVLVIAAGLSEGARTACFGWLGGGGG